MDRALTAEEVAARLRKGRKTVQRWILAGKLPATKFGRSYLIPETAADRFIVPVVCEFFSALGLKYLLENVRPIQRRVNRELHLAGILASMYDDRTTPASEIFEGLKAAFPGKVHGAIIRRSIRVAEAPVGRAVDH